MRKYFLTTLTFFGWMAGSGSCQNIDTLVDVGGYRLHFHILRGKGMPILFEAGGGGNGSDWDSAFLAPIATITGATLITYDRPGVGKSELDSSNHDLNRHGILEGIEGLEKGLKKLGYNGNIVLVAHSFGGFCATLYAARHPSLVKTAVLIDANHVSWFTDAWVDTVTEFRRRYWAKAKDTDLASYYQGLNLPRTVQLMRKTPFPATIPVTDLVSQINFPDSDKAALWSNCHRQFVAAAPNRRGITAYGCGHFIFRDNPLLAISAIVKAYTGTLDMEQGDAIRKRFLSYSLEAANDEKKREVQYRHSMDDLTSWGRSLLQQGEKVKAIEVLKLDVSLYPGNTDGYESLAEAFEAAGDKELAIKNYKQALQISPGNANATDHLKKLLLSP